MPLPALLLCPLSALPCAALWCREDLKHLKAKLKKLEDKMGKDSSKGQELAAELARLQEDVPALQARAADLELRLAKAQEVGGCACWVAVAGAGSLLSVFAFLLAGRPGEH